MGAKSYFDFFSLIFIMRQSVSHMRLLPIFVIASLVGC
jgi:hypothetical protein